MLKRNALSIGLALLLLTLWAAGPVVGDDDNETEPSVEAQLAEHEARIAALERMVGDPPRNAGSIDARIRAAELELESIARDLAEAQEDGEDGVGADGDQDRAIRQLERAMETLQTRMERLDHNRVAAIERQLTAMQRELRNLDNRLRRVE
ncbi:MAG: hypothetical protein ACIAXF_15225 [Phycisphaerales bacterium JB063]